MPTLPRRAALAAVLVPVLALSACGSDDTKSDTTAAAPAPAATAAATAPAAPTTAPTAPATTGGALDRAALAEQANAVCKVTNDASNTITPPPANADNDHVAAFYDKLATMAATQQAGLEALSPDAATKEEWEAFLALTKKATDLVQGIAPSVRVDSAKSDVIIKRVSALSPRINAAADALGARVCGSDSGKG